MKKHYFLSLFISIAIFGFSQTSNIHIYDTTGVDITGQSITVTGASDIQLEADVLVKQTTGSTRDIGCRRYEISIISGTMNYFCWWQCYAPQNSGTNPVWTAPDPLTMASDSMYHNFHGYHNGMSNPGTATYRYVFYDISNPSDSAYVDIIFDTWPASINELQIARSIKLYPNPVKHQAKLSYDFPANTQARLIVADITGKKVLNTVLQANTGYYTLNAEELKSGIYFYSVVLNNKKITTRKFVVFR